MCFPHLRSFNKNKLDFKSSPCTFLGYSPHHKGYKCLDSKGKFFFLQMLFFMSLAFLLLLLSLKLHLLLLVFILNYFPLVSFLYLMLIIPLILILQSLTTNYHNLLGQILLSLVPLNKLPSPVPTSIEFGQSNSSLSIPPPQPQSTHPMQNRSKSGNVQPQLHPTLFLTTAQLTYIKHALSFFEWKEAMQQEYNAFMANNTWPWSSYFQTEKPLAASGFLG